MTLRLLVAEDEQAIAKVVSFGARMTWPGCQVMIATNGADALKQFAETPPDLVVLDVSMPPPDGLAVCQHIREVSTVPILMLTARDSTMDKVRALDLGADDYLTKPFDHLELLARLRALMRRTQVIPNPGSPPLVIGDIALNLATHEVRVKGEAVVLTTTEYRLLEVLMRHAGTALPHEFLLREVWGETYSGEIQYLRVFVRRLRRKLGDDADQPRYIQTAWNTGYRFIPAS
jgi:two-component system KDP operon response regulator KdpE